VELLLPCEIPDYTDFSRPSNTLRTSADCFRPASRLLRTINGCRSRITAGRRPSCKRHYCAAAQWADRCERRRFTDFFSNTDAGLRAGVGRIRGAPAIQWATNPIAKAEDHLFGVCLLNDLVGADIQSLGINNIPLAEAISSALHRSRTLTTESEWASENDLRNDLGKEKPQQVCGCPRLQYLALLADYSCLSL